MSRKCSRCVRPQVRRNRHPDPLRCLFWSEVTCSLDQAGCQCLYTGARKAFPVIIEVAALSGAANIKRWRDYRILIPRVICGVVLERAIKLETQSQCTGL
jgi:hypothetical protein